MADPQELALDHFEKIVLLLALGVLGFIGAGFASAPAELSSKRFRLTDLKTKIAQIDGHMKAPKPATKPPADLSTVINSRFDASGVPSAEPLPKWLMHRRPHFFYWISGPKKKHPVIHRAPVDLKGDANSRGKIELSWAPSDENRLVVITEYQLQRKIGRDGKWKNLATLEPTDKPTYIDKAIQSRVDYYYRVISIAEVDRESPIVRDEDLTLPEKDSKKTSDEEGPHATKRDVFMMPTRVNIGDKAALEYYEGKMPKPLSTYPKVGTADIRVWKWDAASGEFVGYTFRNVKEGEAIGKKQTVRVAKQRREVDFSTGATLKFVTMKKLKLNKGGNDYTAEAWVIQYEFKDGTKEETNHRQKPPELKGVR